jgi:hypothetical protein
VIDLTGLKLLYPEAEPRQIKAAVKYQEKFSLTLENLKCLNPDCNRMRKWGDTVSGFYYTCSKECFNKTKSIRENKKLEARIKTSLSKYGIKNAASLQTIKELKIKNSRLNYNCDSPNTLESKILKTKKTCIDKYGTSCTAQRIEIKTIIMKNNVKHNVDFSAQRHITNLKYWGNKNFWIDNFITNDNHFDYIKCMLYFNCKQPTVHNQIKKLGIKYTKTAATSLQEQAIIPYLESLGVSAVANERAIIPNQELDIWIPSLKLAIEWNGSYWHSYHETIGTGPKQLDYDFCKYRHQRKALACLEVGIRLLQLYEDMNLSNWKEQIDKFIVYDPDTGIDIYDLDSGCYPLNPDFETLEPESRMVLKNRTLWNAGKIKIKRK